MKADTPALLSRSLSGPIVAVSAIAAIAAQLFVGCGGSYDLPPESWSKTLHSGSEFRFTFNYRHSSSWNDNGGGKTIVAYKPSTSSEFEHVGELGYPLSPVFEDFAHIHEEDELVFFASKNRVFVRRDSTWSRLDFSPHGYYPGKDNPLVEGKILSTPNVFGYFKFLGVSGGKPSVFEVLYAEPIGSWKMKYNLRDMDQPLELFEVESVELERTVANQQRESTR